MNTIAIVFASFCLASAALAQTAPAPAAKAAKTAAPAASENAVFPSAVNPKYFRLWRTGQPMPMAALDGSKGGGGGYWALCDKHLKGV